MHRNGCQDIVGGETNLNRKRVFKFTEKGPDSQLTHQPKAVKDLITGAMGLLLFRKQQTNVGNRETQEHVHFCDGIWDAVLAEGPRHVGAQKRLLREKPN